MYNNTIGSYCTIFLYTNDNIIVIIIISPSRKYRRFFYFFFRRNASAPTRLGHANICTGQILTQICSWCLPIILTILFSGWSVCQALSAHVGRYFIFFPRVQYTVWLNITEDTRFRKYLSLRKCMGQEQRLCVCVQSVWCFGYSVPRLFNSYTHDEKRTRLKVKWLSLTSWRKTPRSI